jgi:2'-5' RNA ligase
MRPTVNDVHIPTTDRGKRAPISKPWTLSNVPPSVANFTEAEKARFVEVANRVLEETGDEGAAIRAGLGAVNQMREKVTKANHAKNLCMLCKENPPELDVLWNGGHSRAWFCDSCFHKWSLDKGGEIVGTNRISEGVVPGRYRLKHSPVHKEVYLEKQDDHTTAVIALWLPRNIAEQIAVKDGLPPEELHITLAFLGETNDLPDLETVKRFVAGIAATHPPLKGTINGIGRFSNTNNDGLQPFYASPDLPDLPALRQAIVEGLESRLGIKASKDHGFIPHITLKYGKPAEAMPVKQIPQINVTFPALRLRFGNVHFDYPLKGVSKKMDANKRLTINGEQTTLGELAKAWLEKKAAQQPVVQEPSDGERIEKAWEAEIIEKQDEKRIVYGVVLRPNVPDLQNDIYNDDEVEKAAHRFMIDSRKADWMHGKTLSHNDAIPVESYIVPADLLTNGYQLKKGDWVVGMHIPNPDYWEKIKKGEARSFSIRGVGRRTPVG